MAELVDNSTQSYFDNQRKIDKQLKADEEAFSVRIDYASGRLFSVWDNALGMDLDDLQRAVQLAAPPPDTSGRSEFGMGMKTACCWLGNKWTIVTKKLGSDREHTLTIDVNSIAKSDSHELSVTSKPADAHEHYTRIEVEEMFPRLRTRALTKTKQYLVEIFRGDIEGESVELWWDGERLEPPEIRPLVTGAGKRARTWKKNLNFTVDGHKVKGWICILGEGQRGRERAGFDLYRRGRVIVGRPLGYRPYAIFGEARNDLLNQRLYGQLEMDSVPVNHLKDDFLWDGIEDKFQNKLKEKCREYIDYARKYRPSKEDGATGVSEAVARTTNEAVAEELSEDEMAEQIEVVEIMEVPDPPDPAVLEAKAEKLRRQKLEPRVVEVGKRQFRIYHPQDMAETDAYFFQQSPSDGEIDIFINDNHPFVAAKAEDEQSYSMFVRMCVYDAIVEHSLLHREKEFAPDFPARLKDQLLRASKV